MKILYDHQVFSAQIYGGISRYFCEIMKSYCHSDSIKFDLSLVYSNNHYLENAGIRKYKPFLKGIKFKGKNRIMKFINEAHSRGFLKRQNFDIFHPTYYDLYFLRHIGKKPYVLTIYDMIHEQYPQFILKNDKTSEFKRILAQRASRIIAISQNTKKDILRFFDVDEDKVDVVYLGNRPAVKDNFSPIGINLPERFILFVGNRHGHKNFNFFIKAVTPLLRKDEDLHIVCAGGERFSKDESIFLDKLGIKNRIFRHLVDDNALSYFYQKACVFVFPSLYEGFGIPVLESLNNNCPVALSNTGSLPEVAGDSGLYFNPNDELSLMEAVSRIIYNDAVRKDLQLKGLEQIKKFNWEKTSNETAKIYSKLV